MIKRLFSKKSEELGLGEVVKAHATLIKGILKQMAVFLQCFEAERDRVNREFILLHEKLAAIDEVDIRIFKEEPSAYNIERNNEFDACWDVFVSEDMTIPPGERGKVETGLVVSVPHGWEVQIRPRSGISANDGKARLVPVYGYANSDEHTMVSEPMPKHLTVHLGTCDAGYRGTYRVIVENGSGMPAKIRRGDKLAQLAFRRIPVRQTVSYVNSRDELHDGDGRGEKGFGQSGSNKV